MATIFEIQTSGSDLTTTQMAKYFLICLFFLISCKKEQLHKNRIDPDVGHKACFNIESQSNQNMSPSEVCYNATCSENATSYEWDFDGNGQVDATGINVCFTFNEPGNYRTTLTTKNSLSNSSNAEETITILPATVLPSFTIVNNNCTARCEVSFTNTSSNLLGDETFSWNFGNGQNASIQNPEKIAYELPGDFSVEFCISRQNEAPACTTQTVTILSTKTFSRVFDFGRNYVGAQATDVTETNDGGFAIIGHGSDQLLNDFDLLFVRLNEDYEVEKMEVINDDGRNWKDPSIGQLPSGELVVLANETIGANTNMIFLRITPEGEIINEFSSNGTGKGMYVLPESGDIVAVAESGFKKTSAVRIRTNPNFKERWQQEFFLENDLLDHDVSSITQGSDGHFRMIGYKREGGIFTRKINSDDGKYLDFDIYKSFENPDNGFEEGQAIIPHNDGFVLTGSIDLDAVLIFIDENGIEQKRKKIGQGSSSIGNAISETLDGSLLITGRSASSLFIIKTNIDQESSDFQRNGSEFTDLTSTTGHDGVATKDGGYLIVGSAGGVVFGSEGGLWIIKTDAQGKVLN